MKKVLVILIVLVVSACTSLSKKETLGCLQDKQVSSVLRVLEKLADTDVNSSNSLKANSKLIETTCNKRVYEKNSYRLLVYQNPVAADGVVQGSISNIENVGSKECLFAAVSQAGVLSPSFKEIIDLHKQKWSWLWDDYDIGPAKWLNCKDRKTSDWFESIATFIHELNHEIREGSCLRFAKDSSNLCFDLDSALPLRSIAKLESFPTKNSNQLAGLIFFQKTYLTDLDQPPLYLFDELNSYILTTRAYSNILKKNGQSAIFKEESRPVIVLPLFLLYSVLYVERLSKSHPDLYKKNFVLKPENITALKMLLAEGENTYRSWLFILKENSKPQKEVEKNLWEDYLRERSKFKL